MTISKRAFWALIAALAAMAISSAIRLTTVGQWLQPFFSVGGEPLMSTHDAYAWLAGAEGINRYADKPLAEIVSFVHMITGVELARIGFWIPILFGPLTAIPIVLLGARKNMAIAGVCAAIAATTIPTYLARTKLGYLDTDILTLFFPTAITCGLFLMLDRCIEVWPNNPHKEDFDGMPARFWVISSLTGIAACIHSWFYGQSEVAVALIGFAFALVIAFGQRGIRLQVLAGVGIVLAGCCSGLAAPAVGLFLALNIWRIPEIRSRKMLFIMVLAVMLGVSTGGVYSTAETGLEKLVQYGGQSVSNGSNHNVESEVKSLNLPGVIQSVSEAGELEPVKMMQRSAGSWWFFSIGFVGLCFLMWRRPAYSTFLPLLILSVASTFLGSRFSMFGGVPLAVGAFFGASMFLYERGKTRWQIHLLICLALIAVFFFGARGYVASMRPSPVLDKEYAKTLTEFGPETESNAQFWQWWDFGYATQYYTGRRTFGDGGKHEGEYLYPMARILTTDSSLQARNLMLFTANTQVNVQNRKKQNDNKTQSGAASPVYSADPVKQLRKMGASKAMEYVRSLRNKQYIPNVDLPPQYLVLSWDTLPLMHWISIYGEWSLENGRSGHFNVHRVAGKVRKKDGVLRGKRVGSVKLKTAHFLSGKVKSRHFSWNNESKYHLLVNIDRKEMFLVGDNLYQSVLVQGVLGRLDQDERTFEKIQDNSPFVTIYRAKNGGLK